MHRIPFTLVAAVTAFCALAASVGAAPPNAMRTTAPAPPAPVFVLTGGGWGHGVGLSQWGALGQARDGRTFEQILATYYPGTQIERGSRTLVRVLLVDRAPKVALTATGPFTVTDATGARYVVRSGSLTLPLSLEAPLAPDGGKLTLVPPVRLVPRTGFRLNLDGTERRGSLTVDRAETEKALQVVNVVPLESYLLSVVPGEMPFGWPLEALKAQAVAARTYALTRLTPSRAWDVYADWRSQMYAGVAAETASTTQAVKETVGKVLTFGGAPAQTLYFSSSGGRTASSADIFGIDLPYLKAVDDPWDATSPNHAWPAKTYTGADLAKALGVAGPVVDVTSVLSTAEAVSPQARTPELIRFVTSTGDVLDLSRTDVRARLGLLSTMFRFGVLALSEPEIGLTPGAPTVLRGVARGTERPLVEKLDQDGAWRPAKRVSLRPDGTFVVKVRPTTTTTYRLVGSAQPGPAVVISAPVSTPRP